MNVSIVMPAYNAGKYIAEAISSVVGQSYKKWELIIVDDASNDDTVCIIKSFLDAGYNIKLIQRLENSGGCRVPRFEGVLAATGDYVCIVDADDVIERDYIFKLLSRQKETDADIVLGRMSLCDCDMKDLGVCVPSLGFDFNEIMAGPLACAKTIGGWQLAMGGMLVKTSFYKQYVSKAINELIACKFVDEVDHRRLLFHASIVANTNAMYKYRQNPDSIIHNVSPSYFDRLISLNYLYAFVFEKYFNDAVVMSNMHYEYIGTVSHCQKLYLNNRNAFIPSDREEIKNKIRNCFKKVKTEKMVGRTLRQRIAFLSYIIFIIFSYVDNLR